MAQRELAFSKTTITAVGAIADLAMGTARGRLLEIGFFVSAMTGTSPVLTVSLFKSSALGTRTTPIIGNNTDSGDTAAALGSIATAWSAAPTLTANAYRRIVLNAVGSGIIWTFAPDKWTIAPNLSAVLNTIAISGTTPNFTLDGYVVWDE